ncbi:hypothetical protein [Novosphingobium sp.]|uniref:hypothetical protein n=1 Tax=Novosphingobium sp. TaxID=1874826 RepID=UPI000BC68605|nr:hypothetical protein [Novosphingobium sp.]OYW50829.1 MAG: hypothetical protein B7Z34_03150 [Novosphingobium sp. 12-62-10]
MIASANRLRSVGWLVLLGLCLAMVLVLAFRVNALRSQIHRAEARIVALKQEKMYLETEFETRANQQQLKTWNDVEFGYAAPLAGQYLEGERQLAAFSVPSVPNAPAPIRVASVDDAVIASAAFPAMVSPLSGKPLSDTDEQGTPAKSGDDRAVLTKASGKTSVVDRAEAVETLNERLGKVVEARPRKPVRTATASEKPGPEAKKRSEKSSDSDKSSGKAASKSASKPAAKATKTAGTKQASKAVTPADKPKAKKEKATTAPRVAKSKEAKAVL